MWHSKKWTTGTRDTQHTREQRGEAHPTSASRAAIFAVIACRKVNASAIAMREIACLGYMWIADYARITREFFLSFLYLILYHFIH